MVGLKEKSRPKIGIALAGANAEGRRIARGYSDAGIDILAVWDPVSTARDSLATELGAASFESLAEMLAFFDFARRLGIARLQPSSSILRFSRFISLITFARVRLAGHI